MSTQEDSEVQKMEHTGEGMLDHFFSSYDKGA